MWQHRHRQRERGGRDRDTGQRKVSIWIERHVMKVDTAIRELIEHCTRPSTPQCLQRVQTDGHAFVLHVGRRRACECL